MAILRKIRIDEISACDRPAQEHARVLIMKRADEEGEAEQNYVKPGPDHIGPEHARLHALATDAVRSTPGLRYSRAVANIFEENPGLRARVKREHLAHALANAGQGTMKMIDFAKYVQTVDAADSRSAMRAALSPSWEGQIGIGLSKIRAKPRRGREPGTGLSEIYYNRSARARAIQSLSKLRALAKRVFGKAAPPDPAQDYVNPLGAESEMRTLAARHHAQNPHKT